MEITQFLNRKTEALLVVSVTHSCHSGWRASAVQAAGGCTWTTHIGWNPAGNRRSPVLNVRALWPFHTKLSRSLTTFSDVARTSCSCSSRHSSNTTTWPAVPATTSVSLNGHSTIFWIARRGSSLYGSNVPTWRTGSRSLPSLLHRWMDELMNSISRGKILIFLWWILKIPGWLFRLASSSRQSPMLLQRTVITVNMVKLKTLVSMYCMYTNNIMYYNTSMQ